MLTISPRSRDLWVRHCATPTAPARSPEVLERSPDREPTWQLRKDIDTSADALIEKYDASGEGFITVAEFQRLQEEVLVPVQDEIGEIHALRDWVSMRLDEQDRQVAAQVAPSQPASQSQEHPSNLLPRIVPWPLQ